MKQREDFLWFRERTCSGESFILGTKAMTFIVRVDKNASIFCVLHVAVAIHYNTMVVLHLQLIRNFLCFGHYCDVNISFVASNAKTKKRSRLYFAESRLLNDVFVFFFGISTYAKKHCFLFNSRAAEPDPRATVPLIALALDRGAARGDKQIDRIYLFFVELQKTKYNDVRNLNSIDSKSARQHRPERTS